MNNNYVRKGTVHDDGLLVLGAAMMGHGADESIPALERAGQNQLVASAVMPTQVGDRAEYEALGFVFGEQVKGDPLFTHCTLPDGWAKAGSDHDMWSYVIDEHGRRRVAVFYKAAFYDRDAFARLETPHSYLSSCLYDDAEPVLDDSWLTGEVAVAELGKVVDRYRKQAAEARDIAKRDGDDSYWSDRAMEHDAAAEKAQALRHRIAARAAA